MPIIDLRIADAQRRGVTTQPTQKSVVQTDPPASFNVEQQQMPPRRPPENNVRHGFWFNIGLGTGSLGCDDCGSRENGLSGGLGIGGTLTPRVRLGAFTNGWYKSESGATLNAGVLVAGIRFYPSETSGFFLLGGLGWSSVSVSAIGFGSESVTGSGAVLGLGWDIDLSRSVSLTPFWNGIGMSNSGGTANFGQIGVGLTVH
jgi:hypothetical protein